MNCTYLPNTHPKLTYYLCEQGAISFKIYPHVGGSLHGLKFGDTTIIKDIDPKEDGKATEERYASSLLFPFPNRLEEGTFEHQGNAYHLPKNHQGLHAIHGCIFQAPFKLDGIEKDQIRLSYSHHADTHFPFSFQLDVSYIVSKNGVSIRMNATNTDHKSFPFGFGWHPYFELNDIKAANISFDAAKEYTTNPDLIITGSRPHRAKSIALQNAHLDTAFQLSSDTVSLQTDQYLAQLNVPPNSYLQLFIPNDRQSIAIEPMSCVGNAFNNGIGIKTIAPNQRYSWEIKLNVSPLPPS